MNPGQVELAGEPGPGPTPGASQPWVPAGPQSPSLVSPEQLPQPRAGLHFPIDHSSISLPGVFLRGSGTARKCFFPGRDNIYIPHGASWSQFCSFQPFSARCCCSEGRGGFELHPCFHPAYPESPFPRFPCETRGIFGKSHAGHLGSISNIPVLRNALGQGGSCDLEPRRFCPGNSRFSQNQTSRPPPHPTKRWWAKEQSFQTPGCSAELGAWKMSSFGRKRSS